MNKKNNLVRMRVEFEHRPLFDNTQRIEDEADFDSMIGDLKTKLFGK